MIAVVQDRFDDETNAALSRFEERFNYPLNETESFRIDHGRDYLRFFRDLGKATCFVAKRDSQVLGVLTTVLRTIHLPGCAPRDVLYLCDLKVSAECKTRRLFFHLVSEAKTFYRDSKLGAYAIVMNGTERTPDRYTGAWGIPRLSKLSEIAIFRIPVGDENGSGNGVETSLSEVEETFHALCAKDIFLRRKPGRTGSRFPPLGLSTKRRRACAILEDTLSSKRLLSGGNELVSSHLSSFAYRTVPDGIEIVDTALTLCRQRSLPALFVSVPKKDASKWLDLKTFLRATLTHANIYGLALPESHEWRINTTEV